MKRLLPLSLCSLALLFPPSALAQDGAATFGQRCASCHTIGEGVRVGPDLAGAHERRTREWLQRFIGAPSAMLDSDADAQALLTQFNGVRMPDLGLDQATVNGLIDYIAACSAGDCGAPAGGGLPPVAQATADDVAAGRNLFLGNTALANGGPACISCHRTDDVDSLGGGTLAKDLTQAFARLGEAGMDAALTTTPFPVMNTIFPDRPLTAEESFALKAYLADVSRQPPRPSNAWFFPLIGLGGLGITFVSINAAWRRRLKSGVRRPLVQKPTRRSRRAAHGGEQ